MLEYRILVEPDDNGTVLVTCPDLPEVTTYAENDSDVAGNVARALEEAIAARISDGRDVPAPSGSERGPRVRLHLLTALKVALYGHSREQGVTRAELSRRLGWHREQVDRLFRLDHASRLDQLEAAFAAIGRQVDIRVMAA